MSSHAIQANHVQSFVKEFHEGPKEDVTARVYILAAIALERDRVASPILRYLYLWKKKNSILQKAK